MAPTGRVPTPVVERIWQRITVSETGCWEWDNPVPHGYGVLWVGSRSDGSRRKTYAHIVAYETHVGPVPPGLEIDHLCRNRACCNPDHLEAVTSQVNMLRSEAPCAAQARQTHCKRGHEFTEANTYRDKKGKRYCRACRKVRGS